ncbi:MAG TPA: hypothetical protein VFZ85_04720 [Jiangellaceae bacterium]
MLDVLAYVVIVASLAYAAWCLYAVVRNQIPREPHVVGAGVVELLLVVQLVVAVILLAVEGSPDQLGVFIAYLVVSLLVLPLGLFWALAEKSRWGTAVLLVAALAVPVVVVRLQQLWDGAGG